MPQPRFTPPKADIRISPRRFLAVGRNGNFPRLADTYIGMRWAGRAAQITASLEQVERGADRSAHCGSNVAECA